MAGSPIWGLRLTAATGPADADFVDATGLCLAPGLVDMRVRLGEPGHEHKERFESGCAAAAAGGVTSMACLPDTEPPIDDPAMVEFVARRARRVRSVKVHPYAAITQGFAGEQIAELGPAEGSGGGRVLRRRSGGGECAGDAPRAAICRAAWAR